MHFDINFNFILPEKAIIIISKCNGKLNYLNTYEIHTFGLKFHIFLQFTFNNFHATSSYTNSN